MRRGGDSRSGSGSCDGAGAGGDNCSRSCVLVSDALADVCPRVQHTLMDIPDAIALSALPFVMLGSLAFSAACGDCVHGACAVLTGRCDCDPGFDGADCSRCQFGAQARCVNGFCSGQGTCVCDRTWAGPACDQPQVFASDVWATPRGALEQVGACVLFVRACASVHAYEPARRH